MATKLSMQDYFDDADLFKNESKRQVKRIPIDRVIEKLDEYFSRNDTTSAERHIRYWISEAHSDGDISSELSLYNELMGLYRKLSRKDDALMCVKKALHLSSIGNFGESFLIGTTYLNIGTVYKAFSMPDTSLSYYEKAMNIYENLLNDNDTRFAGLYNNMALALVDLNDFEKARYYYKKAIEITGKSENEQLDCAISHLNLANLEEKQFGLLNSESKINSLLDKAIKLIDTETLNKDGYYAFVCEKCAPTFDYYGYFIYAKELKERAKKIYERD